MPLACLGNTLIVNNTSRSDIPQFVGFPILTQLLKREDHTLLVLYQGYGMPLI